MEGIIIGKVDFEIDNNQDNPKKFTVISEYSGSKNTEIGYVGGLAM